MYLLREELAKGKVYKKPSFIEIQLYQCFFFARSLQRVKYIKNLLLLKFSYINVSSSRGACKG